jgi:hypothetical protein
MKCVSILLLTATSALATLSVPRSAFALDSVDVEVAAKFGGGTNPLSGGQNAFGVGGPNALDFGAGIRLGASLKGFYGGLAAMYYGGSSQDVLTAENGLFPYSSHEAVTSVLYGIEAGYDVRVAVVTLRPQLGVGNCTLSESGFLEQNGLPSVSSSKITSSVYLEPGVTGLLSFGPVIVGADANVLFLPRLSGSQPAFTAHGQVGVKF